MSYQKKSMKPYIEGLQDGSVCHRIMYQKKEDVIETDDIVKKVPRVGFEITYLSYFFNLFDQLAGKSMPS